MSIFALINPRPYNTKINKLLFIDLVIPKDQKKNIALSSHGIAVCKIPIKNAGMKIVKISRTIVNWMLFMFK